MKALLYKEFKLAMHPMCYLFVLLFPFMILIPSYPIAIGSLYILTCYPVLFLGANKGQQSNDLLFSTLLPVRKKDIVLARIITVMIMQFAFILITSLLVPFAGQFQGVDIGGNNPLPNAGIEINGYVTIVAFEVIGYAIADLIFFPMYYKNGKSVLLPALLSIFFFAIYISVFTIILPYIPGAEWFNETFVYGGLGTQFAFLAIALVVYALIHFAIYKISSKRLEKVDF